MKLISWTKKITATLLFLVTLAPAAGLAQEKVVAIVNNDVITQKDLNDFINFMRVQLSAEYRGKDLEDKVQSMKLNLLDKLIEDQLILQEAKRVLQDAWEKKDMFTVSRLDIDQERIKTRIADIKKKFNSDAEFQRSLKLQGLVQADLERRIREQLLMYNIIDLKVRSKIIVSPTEVTEFYEEHKEEFRTPQEREFNSLTIGDEAIARQIYGETQKGRPLDEVARQYSIPVNTITAAKGELMKEVEDVVFGLDINEVSRPLKIENAFSIFSLVKMIPSREQGLSETQETIQNYLFERKMQKDLTSWLDELKERSYIKILSD